MGNSFSNISAFQSLHIVMLGLDSAGKTTVLYRLKFNEFVNTVPTIGFNTEKIKLSNGTAKGISCHFWDVGGQEKLRPLWKSYSRCTDGIIYVVDSVDVDRLEEAKTELHKVTKFAENQGTPLLVIANKQDLPKSLPVADIEKQLALHELTPSTTYHVQPACAIIGEGLHEGMDKLEPCAESLSETSPELVITLETGYRGLNSMVELLCQDGGVPAHGACPRELDKGGPGLRETRREI
ncbi:unnamed protein product [Gadus morhua 'NCC']